MVYLMVKILPPRPMSGGTANGTRPMRYNYWRTGYGSSIFPNLDFYVVQAGEYHCKANYHTGSFERPEHTHFFYHLAGEAIFEYTNQRINVSKGDIFFVPPHHSINYGSSKEIVYHWFALEGHWPQFLGDPRIGHLSLGTDADVEDMFVEIRASFQIKQMFDLQI